MIGLSYIQEVDHLIENVQTKEIHSIISDAEQIHIDEFDFHNSTFLDFIEYIEFQDYTDYIFLTANEFPRIRNIIEFLQAETYIKFHLVDIDFNILYGEKYILEHLKNTTLRLENQSNSNSKIYNGLMSLFTGVYPQLFNKNLIKHLYVDDMLILSKINKDMILNAGINSSVYINEVENDVSDHSISFPMIKIFKDTLKEFKIEELAFVEKVELEAKIDLFKNKGIIENCYGQRGIVDYASKVGLNTNNRIFFFNDGIYSDFSKTLLLSEDLSSYYLDVITQSRSYFITYNDQDKIVRNIFPMMFNISSLFNVSDNSMVTPYNHRKIEPKLKASNISRVGIQNEQGCYVFDIQRNKLYQTNDLFLHILEYDMKDKKELLKDDLKYQNVISEYEELVNNG
jgi:hypothetical protein